MYGKYMVNTSDGLNFLFLKCEQIEPMVVGYEKQKVLLITLIHWNLESDDILINLYASPNYERKLATGYINKIAIKVEDINEQKIIFDSGKIVLDVDIIKKLNGRFFYSYHQTCKRLTLFFTRHFFTCKNIKNG